MGAWTTTVSSCWFAVSARWRLLTHSPSRANKPTLVRQEPEHEGGLGMPVGVAGTVMLVQGLLSTLMGPPIGRIHDRTSRKKLLFAALPISLLVIT
jgi:MFS family permease